MVVVSPRWNPPWCSEGAYQTKTSQPAHQQKQLVGVKALYLSRTNESSYILCQGLDSILRFVVTWASLVSVWRRRSIGLRCSVDRGQHTQHTRGSHLTCKVAKRILNVCEQKEVEKSNKARPLHSPIVLRIIRVTERKPW